MKTGPFLLAMLLSCFLATAQKGTIDSLTRLLKHEKTDTGKIVHLYELSLAYQNSKPDSSLILAREAYDLSKKKQFIKGESWSLNQMAFAYNSIGNFTRALQCYIEQIKIEETRGYAENIAGIYLNIALLYSSAKEYDQAILYAKRADSIIVVNKYNDIAIYSLLNIGDIYEKKNVLDSALAYTTSCYDQSVKEGNIMMAGTALINAGTIYLKSGKYDEALNAIRRGLPMLYASNDFANYTDGELGLSKIFEHDQHMDSAIFYAKKSYAIASQNQFLAKALEASESLSRLYKRSRNTDSALAYQEIMIALKDSIGSRDKITQFQNISFGEQLRLRELEEEKVKVQNQVRTYALLAGILVFMVIAFLLFRNNRIRRKTNLVLEQQKNALQKALQELESTQAQLIQSEKMASLGELTAGIAHEIQNPLNFVNNFSEVSSELIAEMRDEIANGNMSNVSSIAEDIAEIGNKINHHGKRADAIVKGMLQHSRSTAGQKEPTDINALAEEYLKLSYHAFLSGKQGLRARDNKFSATIKKELDPAVGKINIIPQELGRVLMNIYNNAFYAIAEKATSSTDDYEPTITITTKTTNGKTEIRVADNGNGIPAKIMDKIFHPFFTTKPTGQGTGLGLSLSYDIIKAQGGELKAESQEGQGAQFVIRLS